jgi:hypothetical protein
VRVSIFAISTDARRQRGDIGRKASQETNWSRSLFTVRTRSKGNELSRPEYRLVELGYDKRRPKFYRHELLGPIDTNMLRNDVKPATSKDSMASLEDDALTEIREAAADAREADLIDKAIEKQPSAESMRFLQANVRRVFSDGALKGVVQKHVMLPVEEGEESVDGERWLIAYENGREELVTPQVLIDILVTDSPAVTKKADDPLDNDPLIGRALRSPEDDDDDTGKIISVRLKKPEGAKKKTKRVRHYFVRWTSPESEVTLEREYEKYELTPYLV